MLAASAAKSGDHDELYGQILIIVMYGIVNLTPDANNEPRGYYLSEGTYISSRRFDCLVRRDALPALPIERRVMHCNEPAYARN